MADIADLAQEDIERNEAHNRAASVRPEGPAACGECLYCGEPLPDGVKFCNAEHRDAWEREQHLRRQNARG